MKIIVALLLIAVSIVGYRTVAPEIELHSALQKTEEPNPEHPTIVMLGDSHTFVPNWARLVSCPNVANFGIGGNTTAQMLKRLPSVIDARPRVVFIMAGTNDAIEHVDSTEAASNLKSMEAALQANGIEFVVLTPPPLPAHQAQLASISSFATLTIPFAEDDLLPDHIHLRRSGYAKWRDAISPIVARYCFRRPQ